MLSESLATVISPTCGPSSGLLPNCLL